MCVPGKLVYLYVRPLPRRRKLYKNDVIYGCTALSGDDRSYLGRVRCLPDDKDSSSSGPKMPFDVARPTKILRDVT